MATFHTLQHYLFTTNFGVVQLLYTLVPSRNPYTSAAMRLRAAILWDP